MVYSKSYYDEKKQDLGEEINQITNRLVKDVYNFVQENERLQKKARELLTKEQKSIEETKVKKEKGDKKIA